MNRIAKNIQKRYLPLICLIFVMLFVFRSGIEVQGAALKATKLTSSAGLELDVKEQTTFKLTISGGSGPYKYRFYVKKSTDNAKKAIGGYTSAAAVSWTPVSAGHYTIYGRAVDARGTIVVKSLDIKVGDPLSLKNFSSSKGSYMLKGDSTTLSAQGIGGAGNYQYFFWVKYPNGKTKTIKGYDSSAACIWKPSETGDYKVAVKVKDGSGVSYYETLPIRVYSSVTAGGQYYASASGISNTGSNCTTAFQSLIDKVWKDGGGTIILEKGTYACTSINLRSGVSLKGQGSGVTTLKRLNGANTKNAFIYIPSYSTGFSISDLGIWGNKSADSKVTNGIGIAAVTDSDHNATPLYAKDSYDYIKNPALVVTSSKLRTYKNATISNIVITGFTGDGVHIGKENYALTLENFTSAENNKNGLYNESTDNFFSNCYIEKNGLNGIYNLGGNNKFTNIKAMWNGIKSHTAYGLANASDRCQFAQVEVQDNYCNGVVIRGNDNSFLNLLSDCNGYQYVNNVTCPQDCILMEIHGNRNIVIGTCSQYRNNIEPVAHYSLGVDKAATGNKLYITISNNCAKRLPSIPDASQYFGKLVPFSEIKK